MVEDEGGKHYFDLSHGKLDIILQFKIARKQKQFPGIFATSWSCPAEQISLPEVVRGASAIDLYIEVTTYYHIDAVTEEALPFISLIIKLQPLKNWPT